MVDPLKWPILDSAGNPVFSDSSDMSSHSQSDMIFPPSHPEFCPIARPLMAIPAPPVPKILTAFIPPVGRLSESESVSSSIGDSLNPDVPEFVPIILSRLGETQNEKDETMEDEISNRTEQSNMESSGDARVGDKSVNEERKEKQEEQKNTDEKESTKGKKEDKSGVLVNGEKEPEDVWKEVFCVSFENIN